MDLGSVLASAITLLAVLLGGRLTTRFQDKLSRRQIEQQWRDIRLAAYTEFLTAFRQYVAFALEPGSHISAVAHPRRPGEFMPFFDREGTVHREKLEAAKTALRLVSSTSEVVQASSELVHRARGVAADRSTHDAETIPTKTFEALWNAEWAFVAAARRELGLTDLRRPQRGTTEPAAQ